MIFFPSHVTEADERRLAEKVAGMERAWELRNAEVRGTRRHRPLKARLAKVRVTTSTTFWWQKEGQL